MRRNPSVVAIIATVVITSVVGIGASNSATPEKLASTTTSTTIEKRVSDTVLYPNPIAVADAAIRLRDKQNKQKYDLFVAWLKALDNLPKQPKQSHKKPTIYHRPPTVIHSSVTTTPPPVPSGVYPDYMPGPGQIASSQSPCHQGGGRALSNPPIPGWVVMRESHGNYCIRNSAGSTACGAYQIVRGTWAKFMGYPNACSAPPWVQDLKAEALWANGRGCGHWQAC